MPLCSAAIAPAGKLATDADDRDIASPELEPPEKPASGFNIVLGSIPRPATAVADDRTGLVCEPWEEAGLDGPLEVPPEFERDGRPFLLRPMEVLPGPEISASPFVLIFPPDIAIPTEAAVVPTALA